MEERFKEAFAKKDEKKEKSDITSFIWKGGKTIDNNGKYKQSEKKLIDMSAEELKSCYEHCKTMLFNQDVKNPGRYLVLELISDQIDRCGVELCLRYLHENNDLTRFQLTNMISEFLSNNKDYFRGKKPLLEDMFNSMPSNFSKLSLDLLLDGCLDRLGALAKKHITRTFILKQGIWLTADESKDLMETDENTGKLRDRIEVIRERLNIKEVEKLYINSKGLNYSQMRAMLNLKTNQKYLQLNTVQLETLRYRVLFSLQETVKNHINSWESRMSQIEKCAEHKGFTL